MGGHEAGEIASGMCVRALAAMPQLATGERSVTAAVLQQYLLSADSSIREVTGARAGTTLTGAVVVEQMGMPYWLVMNIGDSRTYRLSQGNFAQVSVDHSEVQELVDAGRSPRRRPPSTRAATWSPGRWEPAMRRKRTTGCCPLRKATGSWSAPTASTPS